MVKYPNYTSALGTQLESIKSSGVVPRLLLHACCAPCATSVLEYLSEYFNITVLFYNPNISPADEFYKRAEELKRLLTLAAYPNSVDLTICDYSDAGLFRDLAVLYPDEPEGGARCTDCLALRITQTAKHAKSGGFDFFTTTLTVSPHKDATRINNFGGISAELFGVRYLFSDFKKRDGYKRSVELSKEFDLYRQTYCGCTPTFSCKKK